MPLARPVGETKYGAAAPKTGPFGFTASLPDLSPPRSTGPRGGKFSSDASRSKAGEVVTFGVAALPSGEIDTVAGPGCRGLGYSTAGPLFIADGFPSSEFGSGAAGSGDVGSGEDGSGEVGPSAGLGAWPRALVWSSSVLSRCISRLSSPDLLLATISLRGDPARPFRQDNSTRASVFHHGG